MMTLASGVSGRNAKHAQNSGDWVIHIAGTVKCKHKNVCTVTLQDQKGNQLPRFITVYVLRFRWWFNHWWISFKKWDIIFNYYRSPKHLTYQSGPSITAALLFNCVWQSQGKWSYGLTIHIIKTQPSRTKLHYSCTKKLWMQKLQTNLLKTLIYSYATDCLLEGWTNPDQLWKMGWITSILTFEQHLVIFPSGQVAQF